MTAINLLFRQIIFLVAPRLGLTIFLIFMCFTFTSKSDEVKTSAKTAVLSDKQLSEKELSDLMRKAMEFEAKGKIEDALKNYTEVLSQKSVFEEYALLFTARLYFHLQQLDKAEPFIEKLLSLSPNLLMANEAQLMQGQILKKIGQFQKAKKIFLSLERKNRHEAVYADLLWELWETEKALADTKNSCKWLVRLYVSKPDDIRVKTGIPTDACQIDLEDRRRRIKNLQWLGYSQLAKDEIEAMKKIKEEDPFDIIMLRSGFLLHEGDVTEALHLLLPEFEKKKTDFNYLTSLAVAAARSGDPQLAVGTYYRAYQLSPKSKLGRQALFQAAFMSYQFQDYDGASRKFQEVLKNYPQSGLSKDAKWHLAWIKYLRGDYEGAYKAFANLRTLKRKAQVTTDDRLQYWMAMSLFRQAKYSEAREKFAQILKMGGQSFYALASQQRLRKCDELMPKPFRLVSTKQNPRLARFSTFEVMIPADDFDGSDISALNQKEESETEEKLALNPLVAKVEQPDDAEVEDSDSEDSSAAVLTSDSKSIDFYENQKLSNPIIKLRLERAKKLIELGLTDWAKWDLYDIERKTSSKDLLKSLINEYESIEQYHRSANIAQNSFAGLRQKYGLSQVNDLWKKAYPEAYKSSVQKWSQEFAVPSNLVWGIMKAESSYRRDVVSPVGAIGLMQIMPNTGAKISDLLRDKSFLPQKLFQPEVSIRLGTKYLQRLGKQFDQNPALIAAGYNAGPHRVRSWLSSFGQLDLDEFIEHIPFLETRNYVKRVLSNSWVYTQLYSPDAQTAGVSLSDPLAVKFLNLSSTKETWEDI